MSGWTTSDRAILTSTLMLGNSSTIGRAGSEAVTRRITWAKLVACSRDLGLLARAAKNQAGRNIALRSFTATLVFGKSIPRAPQRT